MRAALIGVAGAFAISLQAATFYYVLQVESRLTRLETTVQIEGLAAARRDRPREQARQ